MSPCFPAIDPATLGDLRGIAVDAPLIPYLLGAIDYLSNPDLYRGEAEDVEATVYAFEALLDQLTGLT